MDIQARYNSPEQKEKIKKMGEELTKNSRGIQKIVVSPEFKNNLKALLDYNMPTWNNTDENTAIKQGPEYLKLKNKFDNGAQVLINKTLEKEAEKN